jgi:hypothetical protein
MGLMARFWQWLTSAGAKKSEKGHPDLYPLDVEKLARELNLNEEAKRLGLAGVPSSDAKVLTAPETAVVQRVEKARQDYVDWAVRRFAILSYDLAKKNVIKSVNRALQADKEFELEAGRMLAEQERSLPILKDSAVTAQRDLAAFRIEHGLQRTAEFPPQGKRFFLKAVLLMMVIAEAVANTVYFAEGDSFGLIGGFVHAGTYAAGNVAWAYLFGKYGIRYLWSKKTIWRVVGVFSVLAAIAGMLAIGLTIAHVRDALSAGVPDAQSAALKTLIESPFRFNGAKSLSLLGISLGFALLALFDGLATDDKYPGYGKVSEAYIRAQKNYDEELDDLNARMAEMKDEYIATLDQEVEKCQSAVALLESLIADKKATAQRLERALQNAANSMDALLSRFRTENEVHRKGLALPGYFQQNPELRPLKLPDFDTRADDESLLEQKRLVKRLLEEETSIRKRIQEAFIAKLDPLRTLSTQIQEMEQH